MGGKSSLQLTLSFLLIAALCLKAQVQMEFYSKSGEELNWTEARLYCQTRHTDLLRWNSLSTSFLSSYMKKHDMTTTWIGIKRDPEQPSIWKGIDISTAEGISGDDLSQNENWANGEQSGACALVKNDLMWFGQQCSIKHGFYCSYKDTIHYHQRLLSWYEALEYCRRNASVLATITPSNQNRLFRHGWIGLYHKAGKNWSWIDNSTSTYRNWAPEEPLTQDCAVFNGWNKKWMSTKCHTQHSFFCYRDNMVMVNEKKTWEDALKYCREIDASCVDNKGRQKHCYDLLILTDLSDYNYVMEKINRANADEFWTGLRYLGGEWLWLNGERPVAQEMLPNCPSQWKHCGSISKDVPHGPTIRDCSESRNFICQHNW